MATFKCTASQCGENALAFRERCWLHLNDQERALFAQEIADWARRRSLKGLNFAGADLRRSDLASADLQEAHLEAANLSYASLSWANLQGAHLRGARLRGCSFQGADLRGADLRNASLEDANLTDSDLIAADFTGACLDNAVMVSCRLQRAVMRGASLRGANLRGAWLRNVVWRDSQGLTWSSVDVDGATLVNAHELAEIAYRGLKIHFQNQGQYDDEDRALRREKEASGQNALMKGQTRTALGILAWRVLADHGTRWYFAVLWLALLILGFSVAYCPNPWGWSGVVALQCDAAIDCGGFARALYFSVVTVTTLGFGDIHPANGWGVLCVVLEVLIGYFLLGVVVACVARKMAR
jgi:uncharacterized protein YjbI with pentapeptide repeats